MSLLILSCFSHLAAVAFVPLYSGEGSRRAQSELMVASKSGVEAITLTDIQGLLSLLKGTAGFHRLFPTTLAQGPLATCLSQRWVMHFMAGLDGHLSCSLEFVLGILAMETVVLSRVFFLQTLSLDTFV